VAGVQDVQTYYRRTLAAKGWQTDAAQAQAIARLQQFFDDWLVYKQARSSPLRKLLKRPAIPRGVYLWGGVGRGKSFLMDAFFHTVPLKRKARLHFHEFMRGVHAELSQVKSQADPLNTVAARIAKRYRLICFDEFHVSDIADAMILYRLLQTLFEAGVAFVMTSNYAPAALYPDGLHRDRLLPAIALIQERLDVLNVDAGVDYRRRALEQMPLYLTPLNEATRTALQAAFDRLCANTPASTSTPMLTVQNRALPAVAVGEDVVWLDFATLCAGPRSQNDYLELAQRFHTLILSDVPRMQASQASEARRFTWLVDVLYDHRVKLIVSAQCEADALYTEGQMAHEFHRTVSRLTEMQSKEYMQAERRLAAVL